MRPEPPSSALVLAGGLGTRLAREVPDLPKTMAPVAGRPFAQWLVERLRGQGIRRIVFCTGFRGEAIEAHFGTGARFGVEIEYSREAEPLGTGGSLRLAAEDETGDRFLAVNGDSWCAFDLSRLADAHASSGHRARATIWTVSVEDGSRYGSVSVLPDGRVAGFSEKTGADAPARINAGVYLFERSTLLEVPPGRAVSLEREVLPALVGRGLFAVSGEGPFIDIGTPESYRGAERFFVAVAASAETAAAPGRPGTAVP